MDRPKLIDSTGKKIQGLKARILNCEQIGSKIILEIEDVEKDSGVKKVEVNPVPVYDQMFGKGAQDIFYLDENNGKNNELPRVIGIWTPFNVTYVQSSQYHFE